MILATERDFSFTINEESLELLNNHLKEKQKSSKNTAQNKGRIMKAFLNYLKKNVLEVTPRDALEYLNSLESNEKMMKSTKDLYRSNCYSFYEYVEYYQRVVGNHSYRNPIPSKNIFKFSDRKVQGQKPERDSLTRDELAKIMKLAKLKGIRDYTLFLILSKIGMRISEAATIRIENIDFTERTITTGMEEMAEKSSRHFEDGKLTFFFTKKLGLEIRKYVLYLNQKSGWLFAGYKGDRLTHSGLHHIIVHYCKKMGFTFGFHAFRRTVITQRTKRYAGKDGRLKIADWESEIIMNHVPKTVEHKHYLKLSIAEKREIFDTYPIFEDLY